LEMVALPLRRDHRPRRNAEEGARFVIRQEGFLEPVTWAPGRFVSALGRFTGMDSRPVGGVPVRHAVMEAEQIELWPVNPTSDFSEFGNLGRPPN
ncbi:MAG: Slp family lipoprotein, partial [Wenzhouxiangellaceae bacterium]